MPVRVSVRRLGLCMVALAMFAGCDRQDDRICSTPAAINTVAASSIAEKEAVADGCVHRWSYRLARSNEPASEVAKAVVGGCQEPIGAWVTTRAIEDGQLTGDRALIERKEAMARFHVVQARAGHCQVP